MLQKETASQMNAAGSPRPAAVGSLVNVVAFFESLARRSGLRRPLAASQIHQAQLAHLLPAGLEHKCTSC